MIKVMKTLFDKKIERLGHHSTKWEELDQNYGCNDLLPMWIADMDFQTAPVIIKAIKEKVEHGIFGYVHRPDSYYQAAVEWTKKRFNHTIDANTLIHAPSVVPSLSLIIRLFTQPNEKILIQPPVYYPFAAIIKANNRIVVENKLKKDESDYYRIDFDDFEKKIKEQKIKWFIFCSPHNPIGRVWKKDELEKLANICLKYNVRVISDEIWRDLIMPGHKHIPFASLSKEVEDLTITCFSASKSFNLAGLQASFVCFPRKDEWLKFDNELGILDIRKNNPFSVVAYEAAYREGETWLEELIKYIDENIKYVDNFLKENIPEITMQKPEGTYLLWLNCSKLNYTKEHLQKCLETQGKLALDHGDWFGDDECFERMNVACPRSILEEGMKRLEKVVIAWRQSNI